MAPESAPDLQDLKNPTGLWSLVENRLGLAIGTALVALFIAVSLFRKKGNRNLPPLVPCMPLVGGLLKFIKGPMLMLREEYDRLGSVFTVKILTKNVTFVIGPEVNSHFFKAPETEMSQKEVYQFNVPTFGPGVVFDVDYSVRMEQFRFFTEALKVHRIKTYVDCMVEEAKAFFSKWGEEGEVNLKDELEKLIILTASRCLLGREVRDQLFENVSKLFHDLDNGMQPISVVFPNLPIPAHRRRNKARKELADVFARIIQNRRASGRSESDMLQVFIDSKYRSTGRSTTEAECTGLLIAALFAGQHTSSITSAWTGAYLMKYKQYWDATVEEQRNILKRHGTKLDYDVLCEMDSLHRSMKEALRLHPPLIMLMRYCHTDFTVKTREGKEYTVPKGHIVATSPAFANRLPHIYKEPNKFDPDRFAEGREEDKAGGAFSYISFGGGRHGCLGETFAYMQVKTIWSILLREYDMDLISPFPQPDWNAMVVGIKDDIMVRYKRRPILTD